MKRLGFVILAMAILGAAAGSFWVGRLGATGRGGHGSRMQHGWLQDAPARVARAERQFQVRSSRLADSVRYEAINPRPTIGARIATKMRFKCSGVSFTVLKNIVATANTQGPARLNAMSCRSKAGITTIDGSINRK